MLATKLELTLGMHDCFFCHGLRTSRPHITLSSSGRDCMRNLRNLAS